MDNDEGFQSEPNVILIEALAHEETENGYNFNNDGENLEENDENEVPSNEQDNQNEEDEVNTLLIFAIY